MAMGDTTDSDEVAVEGSGAAGVKPGGRKKLILVVAAVLLVIGGGAAVYFSGLAGKLLGGSAHAPATVETGSLELPDIIANLNSGPRHTSFVKLKVRLELSRKTDEAAVRAAQPRILDLFQTYLRDMHPEELRGSAATYRLREELIARANIALAPARVNEILFLEMLIQ
jgi:flagellar FliL protein